MSIYDDIDDVKVGQSRDPFLAGSPQGNTYRVALRSLTEGNLKDERGFLKASVLVKESSGEGANPANSFADIMITEEKKFKMHKKDIKRLGAAILNEDVNKVTAAQIGELVDSDLVKDIEFRVVVTQENPDSFPKTKFFAIASQG